MGHHTSLRRRLWAGSLYSWALLREFRSTLVALAIAEAVGTGLYLLAPPEVLDGHRAGVIQALYATWMAMFAQPVGSPSECWYITLLAALYPLIGFIIFGEGIVRLAMLLISRRQGEKEWTMVMASTYRDHVILCGLGHLGFRILQELLKAGVPVVAMEKDADGRFVVQAKETGVPILLRDAKEDQALIDAGIHHARSIIIATNDDLANLEVALDARRMNPKIRVVMRLFDEQIVQKLSDAMDIDVAFSSSMVAAPIVTAMALQCNTSGGSAKVLSSTMIDGVCHVAAELHVTPGSALIGKKVGEVERSYEARLLARSNNGTKTESTPETTIAAGDRLVVHAPTHHLAALSG
jgi:voltage-gated potassium channel